MYVYERRERTWLWIFGAVLMRIFKTNGGEVRRLNKDHNMEPAISIFSICYCTDCIKEDEVGGACVLYMGDEKPVQTFCQRMMRKEVVWGWRDNIKAILREILCGAFSWI
jgi:hypothetical protein